MTDPTKPKPCTSERIALCRMAHFKILEAKNPMVSRDHLWECALIEAIGDVLDARLHESK